MTSCREDEGFDVLSQMLCVCRFNSVVRTSRTRSFRFPCFAEWFVHDLCWCGRAIVGSAVKAIVKSMSPMADSIQISFHRKTPGISTDEAGIKTTVRVRRRDLFGNPYDHFEDGIAEGPLTWARSLPLPQCPFFIVAKVLICISVHGNNRGHIRPLDPTRICTHAKAQVPPRTALLCPGAQLLCN